MSHASPTPSAAIPIPTSALMAARQRSNFGAPHTSSSIASKLAVRPSKTTYDPSDVPTFLLREDGIEYGFIGKL